MTQTPEPVFDKKEQLEQIRSGLMDGEKIYAVYDATGAGTGFIAATDRRVVVQDKSFAGKKVALVSLPYSRINSVAVTSNKSLMGGFFSSSSIAVNSGNALHEVEFRGQDKAHHMHNLILWHITR
jgi:Bacterial PH domain